MASLAAAVVTNLIIWGVAYVGLSRRAASPVILWWLLAAISGIGAAMVTSSLSLPEADYLVVVAAPLALTALVTIWTAMRQR
jgi:hypothetical protein